MLLLLIFKVVGLLPVAAASDSVYDLVITHATVVDGFKVLENQTLWVQGGRIVRLSPQLPQAKETVKTVIDGSRLYLIPGFVIPRNLAEAVSEKASLRQGITEVGAQPASEKILELPALVSSSPEKSEIQGEAFMDSNLAVAMSVSTHTNVFEELRKIRNHLTVQNKKITPSNRFLLKMATANGAQQLGLQDVGQLDIGFVADIVAIQKPRVQILPGPHRYVIEVAGPHDIQWVLKKGQLHEVKKQKP